MAQPLYDVALSFAGEQREYVRSVAAALKPEGVTYFFDEERRVELWGRNLVDELDSVYRAQARFVVMFISAAYVSKVWTNVERQSAQARAIETDDPYVLPVRFDDMDLPGQPPSIHYIDARTTAPEELAHDIVAKVKMSRREDAEEDRGPLWEYLLFIDELASGIAGYDLQWRDFELKYVRPTGHPVTTSDVVDDLQARTSAATKIIRNLGLLLNETVLTSAFGAPGKPGDATTIRHVAGRVVDVYASLLVWAADMRGALVPDKAEPIYWILSELVDLPIHQIRDFVTDLDVRLRPAIEEIRGGNVPEEPVQMSFSLTLSIGPGVMERYRTALEEFRQSSL